jgi:hypothetical protein
MKIRKSLGIGLDHSIANLSDTSEENNHYSISSKFIFSTKEEVLIGSENIMNNNE